MVNDGILFMMDYSFQKFACCLKTALGHAVPEVEILRTVVVFQRHVADDAERNERRFVNQAGLCNGATLHVYSYGLGEMFKDSSHFLARVDEPFAADGQPRLNFYALGSTAFSTSEAGALKRGGMPIICP